MKRDYFSTLQNSEFPRPGILVFLSLILDPRLMTPLNMGYYDERSPPAHEQRAYHSRSSNMDTNFWMNQPLSFPLSQIDVHSPLTPYALTGDADNIPSETAGLYRRAISPYCKN